MAASSASGDWLFVVACIVGGLVAAAAGYVVGLPSLRLRGDYLAIVTLGLRRNPARRAAADEQGDGRCRGRAGVDAAAIGCRRRSAGRSVSTASRSTRICFGSACFLTITVVAAYRIKQSSIGRAMLAVREDEIAAQAMGVDIAKTKVRAFVLAALFAGMAGGLFAHEPGLIISPKDAGFQRSFDYLIMTVLGGRGSISGVMLAAAILTALPEFLRDFDQYRLIVYALLLIAMMLVRPQGLFGIHEIWQIWPRRRKSAEAKA